MIKRKDLEQAYWGPNRIPPEWKSVAEIAKAYGLDPSYVNAALDGYKIPKRSQAIEAHVFIWAVLEGAFRMLPDNHFLYQTEMNRIPIDFYLVNESIGIVADPTLPPWEVKTLHVGNGMIVKIGCTDPVKNGYNLESQLRSFGVKPKYAQEEQGDEEW